MRLKGRTAAALLGAVSLAFLASTTACASDAVGPSPAETREAPGEPDVTFYVVAFHWGWGVFDETGRELDGIQVPEGTTVELYAVNPHAAEAIGHLPAPVAAAISAIEWDGERVRSEVEVGRLPDPQVLIGMSLDEILAAGHDDADGHDDEGDAHDDEGDAHDDDGDAHVEGDDDDDDGDAHVEGDAHDDDGDAHVDEGDAHDNDAEAHVEGAEPDAGHSMLVWQMPWQGESALDTHGFLIPWYGVAKKLEPDAGEPVRVIFTADRPGTFEFICTVYCGWGHEYQPREMLVVAAAQ